MSVHAPSNAPPETESVAQPETRQTTQNTIQQVLVTVISLSLIVALAAWALKTYLPPVAPYGERAAFIFPLLILLVELGARWLAYRALLGGNRVIDLQAQFAPDGQGFSLPQITLPLYLACAVLLGAQTAVLAAVIIETLLQIIAITQQTRGIKEASYRVATNGVVVLAGGGCYTALVWIAGQQIHHPPFEIRLGAAAVGAMVMLILYPAIALPLVAKSPGKSPLRYWTAYFRTPAARFQLLLLSIGPLLPLVEELDDLEAELAWVLFLAPLFAIYYLAIVSLRFQRQTEELRASLQALRQARRRQAELQDYAALVIRAQEDERRRLSRELHDDTAQALIALSRGLEALADSRSAGRAQANDARWVEDLRELADRSLESVRRACRDLRPSILDDLGLAAALDWLAEGAIQRGLPCTLRIEGSSFAVPGEAELVFFRIAQEALSNVWRHAQASQAEVLLAYEPGLLRLRVQDDGQAFDLTRARQRRSSSLGILGMRERAGLVGAELKITSTPGQGTAVEVCLALPTGA
ncbi:MAG TPA: sensor histidine kinase [Ktedonobacterales bacterium]|jgi:signal transduction histidine kinase